MNVYQYAVARVHAQLLDQTTEETIPSPELQAAIRYTGRAVDRYRKEEDAVHQVAAPRKEVEQ